MDFIVTDDLYQAGTDAEDGTPIYGRAFFVMAQNERGERWVHHSVFKDTEVRYMHEGGYTSVQRRTAEAEAAATRLLVRIRAAGAIDLRHWFESDPEYGSVAYQEIDAYGGHRYNELRAAEDRGELPVGAADRMAFA